MSHKKKLLNFLSSAADQITQSTTQSLQSLKKRTSPTPLSQPMATPAFNVSQRQQPSNFQPEQPISSDRYNNSFINDEPQPSPTSPTSPHPIPPITLPANKQPPSTDPHFNMNSVLTERSELEADNTKHEPKNRLSQIEEEKIRIQEELKNLDRDIEELKEPKKGGNGQQHVNMHKKYKEISEDPKAFDQAQKLVLKLNQEKKVLQEKKEKEQRERIEQMERESKLKEQERLDELDRIKQEKREAILRRINEEQKKRQERRMIDQQSNALIRQIKKEEAVKLKPSSTTLEIKELQTKKKLLEQKRKFDFADIQEHQRRYRQIKQMHLIHRSEQPHHSISAPKYPKGMFLQRIQQQEKQKKQLQKLKEEQKRAQVQKRLKYGQLVKKIFLPPKPKKSQSDAQPKIKPPTPDVVVNGPLNPPPISRKTYNHSQDISQRQSLRMKLPELAKATVGSSLSKIGGASYDKLAIAEDPLEREERSRLERERQEREKELRRQTKQRMKHAEEMEKERMKVELPKVKKYQNYLEKLPKQKQQTGNTEWKKIIEDQHMSKEQKYKELMTKATMMENKAKFKEEMGGSGVENEQAMNLIIGSIQAKLALLDKF